eukprot:2739843-Lingulodinium_polyedra.AAC.1
MRGARTVGERDGALREGSARSAVNVARATGRYARVRTVRAFASVSRRLFARCPRTARVAPDLLWA